MCGLHYSYIIVFYAIHGALPLHDWPVYLCSHRSLPFFPLVTWIFQPSTLLSVLACTRQDLAVFSLHETSLYALNWEHSRVVAKFASKAGLCDVGLITRRHHVSCQHYQRGSLGACCHFYADMTSGVRERLLQLAYINSEAEVR